MRLWFPVEKYLKDKTFLLEYPLDDPPKRVSWFHYYKLEAAIWAIPGYFLILLYLLDIYVLQPKKEYLPIPYVNPCGLSYIVPINEYIHLKAKYTKYTKDLEALNRITDLELPTNLSMFLLHKKQLIASTYSTLEAEFNYQNLNRIECYTNTIKAYFDGLDQIGHKFVLGYFVLVFMLFAGIALYVFELKGCHLTKEEQKMYCNLLFWAQVFVHFIVLFGIIVVIDFVYPLTSNDKYIKDFPL